MRDLSWTAAAMLAAAGTWLAATGTTPAGPALTGVRSGAELDALEARVSHAPNDHTALVQLTDEYLSQGAPGLAAASLERAPEPVKERAVVADAHARALTELGNATVALDAQKKALRACAEQGCSRSIVARGERRLRVLSEMVRLGVQDHLLEPNRALIAYRIAVREVALEHSSQ
ncbi:MAG TPA: hypothetical protein PKA88_02555 [Polyangiaceae bacterium]|nr:hypothetical protein [Polyangiaceae bacterium]